MAIPGFQEVMRPLLNLAQDGANHSKREGTEYVCNEFNLTEDECRELGTTGRQAIIDNRVGWANTYLKKAGLLESPRRGYFRITQRGRDVLKENPSRIDVRYLRRFSELVEFITVVKSEGEGQTSQVSEEAIDTQTPQDLIEKGYRTILQSQAQELLQLTMQCSPKFFEKLVVELIVAMGYGGSFPEASKVIGASGDEGIDGVIKEDKLGLETIHLQAKRWTGTVGRPEIHKFVGALQGQHTRKGIFITTSTFTREALDYVTKIDSCRVILIDGQKLATLMIEHNIGVTIENTYELKRVDNDYFNEE